LFACGFHVVMTDLAWPTAIRRTVSFCSAIPEGEITVEGVRAVGCAPAEADALTARAAEHIAVFVDPAGELVARWRPDVIVDGRILKRNAGNRLSDAPLVIGMGPGLEAGRDVHAVVETNRGHDLGRVIERGFAELDTHEPGDIGGYTRERLVVAPCAGRFATARRIGEQVRAGDALGSVEGAAVRTAIAGVVRGLALPGLVVVPGQKLGDVDPRGEEAFCHTISDKARTISGGVLEIVVRYEHGRRAGTA
jgi:xanthine dehydrogenase accessory factor